MDLPRLKIGFLRRKFDCDDGISSHCETLMRGLRARGHEIVVFSGEVHYDASTRSRYDALQSLASKWVKLTMPRRRLSLGSRAVREIAAELRSGGIDVLHLHGMGTLLIAKLAGAKAGVPTVATVHLTPGDCFASLKGVAAAVLRPLSRSLWPDRLIAISSELKTTFVDRYRVPAARVDTVFNGVAPEAYRPAAPDERAAARRTFGLGDDDFVVAHIGRLVPVKGHAVLLRGVAEVMKRQRPDGRAVKVVCRGTGPDRESLESLCRELGIAGHVRFVGHGDALPVYHASDALVLPSLREGFPLVVIEAMLCGVVPLRTPAAGAADQIRCGVDGFVFPFGDHAALAGQLKTLIDDPARLAAMRAAAIDEAARRFTADTMVAETIKVYRRALAPATEPAVATASAAAS